MGIWDAVSSAVDGVRNRLPDPQPVKNAGRVAYSAVSGKLTGGAPDLRTPIAGILRSSYDHGRSALSTADRAVRVDGVRRVRESMPDQEVLKKIGWNVANITIDSYSRAFTGGLPIYRVVVEGLKKDVKPARNAKEDELQEMRNRLERLEAMLSARAPVHAEHQAFRLHQKPEDVIRIFMMKGFTGGDFIDDQVMPPLLHEKLRRDALLCPVQLEQPIIS